MITLGIIGIVAALTMPALVASHQEKVTVTKIKKLYSALQQGYTMAEQEYGDPTNWGLIGDTQGAQNMAEKFKPYLKVVSENSNSGVYTLNLADGSALKFYPRSATCTSNRGTGRFANSCAVIEVHFTHANTVMGKTSFQFIVVKDGVIPSGLPDDAARPFAGDCKINGFGCTAWVIYNENMDYLHCDDLSWNGKTKCD